MRLYRLRFLPDSTVIGFMGVRVPPGVPLIDKQIEISNNIINNADVAQLVELLPSKHDVASSSLVIRSNF